MNRVLWYFPILYILILGSLLWSVWSRLNNASATAIISVLADALAGVIGSFVGALITSERAKTESEDRLKRAASAQALELTKLDFEMRRRVGQQKQFLAPAKVYREFYRALFELYSKQSWPKAIEDLGLLNIITDRIAESEE